ncbi:MAG: DUF1549 and DUF1553 domain-containing protein [Planctomycetales bacterium]
MMRPAAGTARAARWMFAAAWSLASCLWGILCATADEPAVPDPNIYGLEVSEDDRGHWAFRPILRPVPPDFQGAAAPVANPIDAFVLQKLQTHGLSLAEPADDRTWLRRVTFDLTGLPPTPEQVAEFLADPSNESRERVVDRLLADPNYGQKWGRQWLDVVRYADTNGYERDGNKPSVWRYRDWVIESLNADKPFDRFLTEQLAGDELPDADAQTMIATTFLRLGTWDDEPAEERVDRYDQLDDVVGTVSATFLGLTLRCARCHNHKFEPLSQIDYTRMLAVFEPLKRPQTGRAEFDLPVGTPEQVARERSAVARQETTLKALEEQLSLLDEQVRQRLLRSSDSGLSPEALAAHAAPAAQRTDAQKKLVADTQTQFDEALRKSRSADESRQREGFQGAIAAIKAGAPTPLPRGYLWEEAPDPSPLTQVFRRGNPATTAGGVGPGLPVVLCRGPADLPVRGRSPESRTSHRREALAAWMTSPDNPLVARVIVNRLWQGHFGNGLVNTENDFGVMGSPPTHPELLDWLAAELRSPQFGAGAAPSGERGTDSAGAWSLKRMHRLIVLSRTYTQSSGQRDVARRVDVDNALLWRFPFRRLDAEALRDAVLAVSGQLNPQMGGPGVYPKIAREVLEGQSRPGDGWGAYDETQAARRAIYIFVKRSLLVPEMELLDFADTTTSCEQRPVSTIPTQALTLLNGDFLNRQAQLLADRLLREAGADPAAQVERGYRLSLSRPPTAEERRAALAFLERQTALLKQEGNASLSASEASRRSLAAFCLVLFNLNEFAYAD